LLLRGIHNLIDWFRPVTTECAAGSRISRADPQAVGVPAQEVSILLRACALGQVGEVASKDAIEG